MNSFELARRRRPQLRPRERQLLGEIRRRPGITVPEVRALPWCCWGEAEAYRYAVTLLERGCATSDHGRLYAVRAR